jgi:hypothetical protein
MSWVVVGVHMACCHNGKMMFRLGNLKQEACRGLRQWSDTQSLSNYHGTEHVKRARSARDCNCNRTESFRSCATCSQEYLICILQIVKAHTAILSDDCPADSKYEKPCAVAGGLPRLSRHNTLLNILADVNEDRNEVRQARYRP